MPPVIIPVPPPTVAVPLPELVLQVPPPTLFVAVTVAALHTRSVPPIAAGTGFTDIVVAVAQPVDAVYVTFVVPFEMPATTPGEPEVFTVPTAVLLLLQVPPVGVGVRDVVDPTHTDDDPDNVGEAFTVIVVETEQLPIV